MEDKEPKYFIYNFTARWTQDETESYAWKNYGHGLPKGRVWNSTGFHSMYKDEQEREKLDTVLLDFWKHSKLKGDNTELFSLHAQLDMQETWCLTWFSHWTFDIGQTDSEAITSFSRYITRMQHLIQKEETNLPRTKWHSLMGAEDYYRWRGAKGYDKYPCRCDACKKRGVISIDH